MLNAKKKVVKPPFQVIDGRTIVHVADCVPNAWNMNAMDPDEYRKLKRWMQKSYKETGRLALPIVVRVHPTLPGKWQIIDGAHRWKGANELNWIDIDAWVYQCDDKTAQMLTDALNYIRGEPDGEKYAEYIKTLTESGATIEEISQYTHKSEDELQEVIDQYDIKIEEVEDSPVSTEESSEEKAEKGTGFVDLKFSIPAEAAEIVEAEIARICTVLNGKNIRGRALEFMAVQSAQTPMEDILPKDEEKKSKKKAFKFSLKKKAKHAA